MKTERRPRERRCGGALLYLRGLFALVLISADDPQQDRHRPQRPADRRRPRRQRVLRRLRHPGHPEPHPRRRVPRRRGDGGHHAGAASSSPTTPAARSRRRARACRGIRSWRRRPDTSTSCSRRSSSSRGRCRETVLGRASVETRPGVPPGNRDSRRGPAQRRARRHPRVRHVVARGAGRQVPDRVARARAGRGRLRLGVPLPRSDRLEEHAGDRDHAVGRNRRHARRAARSEEEGRPQHRDLQRGRQHGDARDRRHGLHARRPGDRRRLDQGVHVAARRAAPAGDLPRPDSRHADAGRGAAAPRGADAAAAAARADAQVRAAAPRRSPSASISAATSSISAAASTIRSRSRAR